MTTQIVFQQLIDELERIRPSLKLKLPASQKSVRLQKGKIISAQERLKAIEEQIDLFANRGIRPSTRRNYLGLKALVSNMILEGNDFKLLAEEYVYDPEGVMLLLQELNQREAVIQSQLQQLKHQRRHQGQIVFSLASQKERSPGTSAGTTSF